MVLITSGGLSDSLCTLNVLVVIQVIRWASKWRCCFTVGQLKVRVVVVVALIAIEVVGDDNDICWSESTEGLDCIWSKSKL